MPSKPSAPSCSSSGSRTDFGGAPLVLFRAQETLASIKPAGWASPAHMTFAGDRRDSEWRGMSPRSESGFCELGIGTSESVAGSLDSRDRQAPPSAGPAELRNRRPGVARVHGWFSPTLYGPGDRGVLAGPVDVDGRVDVRVGGVPTAPRSEHRHSAPGTVGRTVQTGLDAGGRVVSCARERTTAALAWDFQRRCRKRAAPDFTPIH